MIIEKLENQFDKLCDEMLNVLEPEVIDVEGASILLQQIAPNASKEAIKNVLEEVKKAADRKKHTVYKSLIDNKKKIEKKVAD